MFQMNPKQHRIVFSFQTNSYYSLKAKLKTSLHFSFKIYENWTISDLHSEWQQYVKIQFIKYSCSYFDITVISLKFIFEFLQFEYLFTFVTAEDTK